MSVHTLVQHLNHPGIVTLEQMFETPEKVGRECVLVDR